MSLVSARVALVHRTTILRSTGTTDAWKHQAADYTPHATDVSCRGWVYAARLAAEDAASGGGGRTANSIEDRRLILPLDTDVTENDRIGDVTYRGATIIGGPMTIDAIIPRTDHLELLLKRVN